MSINQNPQDMLNARQELRSALNEHLTNLEGLIDFADSLRKDKKRKDADTLLKLVDDMIENYKTQDEVAKNIVKELE